MNELNPTPRILQVDMAGLPKKWISIEDAVLHYAKGSVLFELGNPVTTYRGGMNRLTHTQSQITTNSIIGIRGTVIRKADMERVPNLTNEKLFERDRHLCAYCGDVFSDKELSRDHIKPVCQGGKNIWNNVVTACKKCNSDKGGRTLEQAKMKLIYLPYTPDRYESFILSQGTRRILADQMEFLLQKVPQNSRLKGLLMLGDVK